MTSAFPGSTARLEFTGEDLVITDLDSGLGTFLDGQQISKARWPPGKRLKIGCYQFGWKRLPEAVVDSPNEAVPMTNGIAGNEKLQLPLELSWSAADNGVAGGKRRLDAGDRLVIGRESNADVRLDDAAVSREHCLLNVTDRGIIVSDMQSGNGTFLDGDRIQQAVFTPGKVLKVGSAHFRVTPFVAVQKSVPTGSSSESLPVAAATTSLKPAGVPAREMESLPVMAGLLGALLSNVDISVHLGSQKPAAPRRSLPPRSLSPAAGKRSACKLCHGKGGIDTWGEPCEYTSRRKKMDCPACEGVCFFVGASEYTACPKCNGKGGIDAWGEPAFACERGFKQTCRTCNGKAFLPPVEVGALFTNSGNVSEFDQASILIRAMVMAAKADGGIDWDEQNRMLGEIGDTRCSEYRLLESEFESDMTIDEFVKTVPVGMEARIYEISLAVIKVDSLAESAYLSRLRECLRLDPAEYREIHRRLDVSFL